MQSNRRFPLPRAVLCFALSTGLALAAGLATPAAAATSRANITGLLALGSGTSNGSAVRSDLILGSNGNFYVAASAGGTTGVGSIVSLTPGGTGALVHALAGPASGGSAPYGALLQAGDGALYGTTYLGGARNLGTVYRVAPDGTYTNLYSFDNASQGGFLPYGGLAQIGGTGDLYGTTMRGGPTDAGIVFRISTTGTLTKLADFDRSNGMNPQGRLAVGPDGSLYGTTLIGGQADRGTVFRITPSGTLTTLYSFPALGSFNSNGVATNVPGANPRAGLTLGSDGNFYGTAYQGGDFGFGTVFRVTPTGTLTVLHSFRGIPTEGARPLSTVSQMPDGSLVGTTSEGGTLGTGTAWRIDPSGNFETLHSFSGFANDGTNPYSTLVPLNGSLYGVSFSDNVYGAGVFFRIDLPSAGVLPVTLTSTPDVVALGSSSTLSWTTSGAASCNTSGAFGADAAVATSGSQSVTPTAPGIYNYILTCTDGAGVQRVTSVPLTVTTPALEPVDGGGDGGGGSLSILGLLLLSAALAISMMRKHPCKDPA